MTSYKTNDPAVLSALASYRADRSALQERARAFAAHFGGEPIYRNDVHGYAFYGVTFKPIKDRVLWTLPAQDNGWTQRPRTAITAKVENAKDRRAELKKLQAEWAELRDAANLARAEIEPFWNAIGSDWGSLMMGGVAYFDHDGYVWVKTGAALAPHMVEVLGSEWHAAQAAFDTERKAA